MSSGHSHHQGFGLNSQALDRLLKNPDVQEHLYQPKTVNEEFDLPYLGGYSLDGKTIYFDRHLPNLIKLQRDGGSLEINPVPFLSLHESLEKALIDALGYGYDQAHKAATAYEKRGVLGSLGPGWWDPYQRVMNKYIKADEHEKLKKLPKDLDMLPYLTPPVDKKLIAHMEMLIGPSKMSKVDAEYDAKKGRPNHHCGKDEGWPHGFCEYYRKDHACTKVQGWIATRGGCKLWERAENAR